VANRTAILAKGVGAVAQRWCSPGSWPVALAVGGAASLKAVAGLHVLVNTISELVGYDHSTRARGCQVVNKSYSWLLPPAYATLTERFGQRTLLEKGGLEGHPEGTRSLQERSF